MHVKGFFYFSGKALDISSKTIFDVVDMTFALVAKLSHFVTIQMRYGYFL